MRVLFVASEASPFVKTGGLADVISSLPKALQRTGRAEASVVLPKYNCIDTVAHGVVQTGLGVDVPMDGRTEWADVWQSGREVPSYFIGNPRYFDRPHPYQENGWDYSDNAERFIFFSRAVLELCKQYNFWPNVIHCHDWHTALIPVFLRTNKSFNTNGMRVATAFTVHNAGYQGRFGLEKFSQTGLPPQLLDPHQGLKHGEEMNLLKGGVLYSDIITTVSPRYSEEIKSSPGGNGLEEVFKRRSKDLFGILNGIDVSEWNPATDPYLVQRYDLNDLSGKRACKRHLQSQFGLPVRDDVPLLAAIMRLSEQKGMHLIDGIIDSLDYADVQFVLVGAGAPMAEERARQLSNRYPDKFHAIVGDHISYDPSVVHQVEAGADIFIMPSLYEPCGLSHMFAMRYGAVPVVRATGGLEDTVQEYQTETGEGNGFKFFDPNPDALAGTIGRAIYFYRDRKDDWLRIMRNAMTADFSWDTAAKQYLSLYEYAASCKSKPAMSGR